MSRCPICELKTMNCDCTEGDKRAYELDEEIENLRNEVERLKDKASYSNGLCQGLRAGAESLQAENNSFRAALAEIRDSDLELWRIKEIAKNVLSDEDFVLEEDEKDS